MSPAYAGDMGIDKSIKKLLAEPTEMRIGEVINIMAYFGYTLARIRGSHFQFTKPNTESMTIPVHAMKVKKYYLKKIKKIIISHEL